MNTQSTTRITRKDTLAKRLLSALLAFVLAASSLPLITTSQAQAATSSDVPSSITFYHDRDGWTSSVNGDVKATYWASDGTIAYCSDMTLIGPGQAGLTYDNGWEWAEAELSALVYNGYPYTNTINGTTFSDGDAQMITQQAIYMYMGQIDSSSGYYSYTSNYGLNYSGYLSDFMTSSMIAAVKYLYNGAKDGTLSAPTNLVVVYNSSTRNFNGTNYTTQPMIYCLPGGAIELQKASSNTTITNNNDCYSLEGAVYGIYSSYTDAQSETNAVTTITTDASGYAKTETGLVVGTYYVKEITAPTGYALDTTIYTVTVTAGSTTAANGGTVYDTPQNDPANILLQKADSETGSTAQGTATLAGAQFTVTYYDGYYDSAEEAGYVSADNAGDYTRQWVFETDEDGYISLSFDTPISGDSLYYDSNRVATFPLGTYIIQETKAPAGYLLSDEIYVRQVTGEGTFENVSTYNYPTVPNSVIRGGVEIYKTDAETDLSTPQGSASLDGTTFEVVTLNDNDVVVDGVTYSKGDVVATLVIENGYAATSNDLLPYGTYSIQEVSAGTGYLLDDTVYTFTIDVDGEIVTAGETDGHIHDQVIRGDIEFTKRATNGSATLAGVAFKITSLTTGESHVLVTDENGYVNTSATWNAHSTNTNGNDWALEVEGTIDSTELDAYAGIWFGDTSAVDDSLGALPYDTYLIQELRCTANEGYQLISTAVTISRNGVVVTLGTLDDPEAEISTVATDAADGDSYLSIGEATIIDKVSYSHLVAGNTYTLVGQLYNADTGEALTDADGNTITSTVTFTPEQSYGTVSVDLALETWELAGITIVVFEILYDESGSVVAVHADLTDTDQQVVVVTPEIDTVATSADGSKIIALGEEVTIGDTVSYTNLPIGLEHTLTGTLMLKSTGEALTDADGNAITSVVTFTPESSSGTVQVTFTFDSTGLEEGDEIVVFEVLEVYRTIAVESSEEVSVDGEADGEAATAVLLTTLAVLDTEELEAQEDADAEADAEAEEEVEIIWLASHEDIEDADQTVTIETSDYGKTGASTSLFLITILALFAAGIATCAYGLRKNRKAATDTIEEAETV